MTKNKQNKKLFTLKCKSLFMIVAFLFPMLGQASPNNFNFQANIRKPDGSRLEDSNVSYRFSYLNALGTCTLYIEDFNNVSMIGTGGNVSFSMGTGSKVFPPASVSLSETFSNNTSNLMSCSEGGSYTPLATTEIRKLKVEFVYTGSGGLQSLNGIEISSVPYSMYSSDSDRLGGVMANLFAKISDFQTCTAGEFLYKDGAGNFYCDTPSSFSGNLAGDVTGTQAATTVARLRGIPLAVTAPTVNQVLQFDGTNWVPQTIAAFGGTVTNVSSTNAYLTVTNPTTTPTLTLNVGTAANTVAAGDDSRIVGAFQTATTLGGDLSGTLPNPTVATVGGKTAAQISTSVDDTLNATNTATASRVVKRDGSGNASFATAQATNFSGRNLFLFEPTDTNFVTVQAPTTFAAGNYVLTLPDSNGSPGQVLSTDGNGVTSWIPASTGSVTSVGAILPLTSTGGATPVIAMPAAATAQDGYLTAANWNTFNNKLSTTLAAGNFFVGNASNVATSTALSGDILSVSDTGVVALKNTGTAGTYGSASAVPTITTDAQGRITNVTTNAYQDATGAAKGILSVGTNLQVAAGVISLQNASTTNTGALTSADWNTFNSKQPAGNYITALTGDVTATGPGSSVATIANLAVTNAKINDVAFTKITGLPTTLSGYGITDSVRNAGVGAGNVVTSIQSGNTAGRPAFGTDGRIYMDTQAGIIYRDSGAAWVAVASTGSGGTVTNVTSANTDIGVATGTSTPVLTLNSGVGANQILKLNGTSQIPAVSGALLTNLDATNITAGTLPIARGGTGAVTANGALNNLLPTQAANAGRVLQTDGTNTSWVVPNAGTVTSVGATAPLTSTGGATPTIAIPAATGAVDGYLTAANFTIFNNKQPAGSYITALTGDITAAGPGSAAATIANLAVTNAKINDVAFSKITGLPTTLSGYGITDSVRNAGVGAGNVVSSIQSGNTAGRPAFGTDGRIYMDTQAGIIYRDNGAAWVTVATTGTAGAVTGTGTTNRVPKFTAAGVIGDSNITDNGTTVSISTDAAVNGIKVGLGAGSITTNTAIGLTALNANTTGYENTANGLSTLSANTSGHHNTASGSYALASNTTGNYNTVTGSNSFNSNTAGSYNAAYGVFTLNGNTTGIWNTAIGPYALQVNTTGNYNTAIGNNAGSSISTGSYNVVIGSNTGSTIATTNNNIIISDGSGNIRQQIDSSGFVGIGMAPSTYRMSVSGDINLSAGSNFRVNGAIVGTGTIGGSGTTGVIPKFTAAGAIGDSNINDNGMFVIVSTDAVINSVKVGRGLASISTNTAVGTSSLGTNTTGSGNTAHGYFTLSANTTGTQNTAMGSGAMYNNTTGGNNAAFGDSALNQNTTGFYNSAFGSQSLPVNTTGMSNTANGSGSLFSNTTGSANSATGFQALYANTTGDNNTASGSNALHDNTIGGYNTATGVSALGDNIDGMYNTATGGHALQLNTSGSNNVANGMYALRANTSGQGNISIGSSSMYNNTTGAYNVVNGHQALYNNTTGSFNVATGYQSMFNNTTAGSNVAYGSYSLNANTTGNSNTGLGTLALYSNSTGNSNTGVGSNAMRTNTTGGLNVSLGTNSLYYNTTGGSNVAVGASSQYNGTTAYYNSSIGYQSLYSNTTGGNNTASGTETLYNNTTGSLNAASGYRALYSNTTASNNTAHGSAALYTNSTGTNNTSSGSSSLYSNTTGNHNTASGASALYSNTTGDSNNAFGRLSLYFNTSGFNNAGFGNGSLYTNTTGYNNSGFGGNAQRLNTTGNFNSSLGTSSLYTNTTGSSNTSIGYRSLYNSTTGSFNIALGSNSGSDLVTGDYNVILGSNTGSTITGTSNNIIISDGFGNIRQQIDSSGNVGIGVVPTSDKLTVYNGTTTGAYTTSGWTHSSDARLKHDINPLQNSLDKILKLSGVEYVFNHDPSNTKQIGFIAQQVEPIFPEVVRTNEKGFKSMIYSNLIAPIIEAIKSLKLMTDTNTREIASLKAENADLKKQLDKQNKDMEQIKKKLGL